MIRLIPLKDAAQLQSLRLLSLQTDAHAFASTFGYESTFPLSYYEQKIHYNTKPPAFGYWGYYRGNQLVGYVQLSQDNLPKTRHIGRIFELYVHPDSRGGKIGTNLLSSLIEVAQQIEELVYLSLEVVVPNKEVARFYSKFNFKETIRTPNAILFEGRYFDKQLFRLKLKN